MRKHTRKEDEVEQLIIANYCYHRILSLNQEIKHNHVKMQRIYDACIETRFVRQ